GGSILFLIPSSPAISIAGNARYGLHEGSGVRNSRRLATGFFEIIGIRTQALRFRCEYTSFTGASNPGTRRRYEFVVGLVNASSDGAWASNPPMYQRAMSLIPAYPTSSQNRFSSFFHRLWCVCMPEPLSWKIGLGMKVTVLPASRAVFLMTYLYFMTLSALLSSVSKRMSISAWPAVPTS